MFLYLWVRFLEPTDERECVNPKAGARIGVPQCIQTESGTEPSRTTSRRSILLRFVSSQIDIAIN